MTAEEAQTRYEGVRAAGLPELAARDLRALYDGLLDALRQIEYLTGRDGDPIQCDRCERPSPYKDVRVVIATGETLCPACLATGDRR
jgi:hypothetical protein